MSGERPADSGRPGDSGRPVDGEWPGEAEEAVTDMAGRGARRFAEDLLTGHRPRSFTASPEDAEQVRAAITLRAAAPEADTPNPDFVADLHRRLAAAMEAEPAGEPALTPAPEPARVDPARAAARRRLGPRWLGTRRRFVGVGAVTAAAAAAGGVVGAAVDRMLSSGGGRPGVAAADRVLEPVTGTWWTVATTADLPEGGVHAFDLGTVTGFVRRGDGQVAAVSGVCTHQGCRLALDAAARRLNCPCHRTVFNLSGAVVHSQLKTRPRALPQIEVREVSGVIQVLAPPRAT